jgi:transposase
LEGTGTFGASLSHYLLAQYVQVHEVNRPDRSTRRLPCKSDRSTRGPCSVAAPGDEDAVAQATYLTLRMLAERVEQLTGQIDDLNQRLTRVVVHHAQQLLERVGIGPDSAVTLLITMGDNPDRLNTEASFPALCGVSPIEYSSGRRSTRRLSAATARRTRPCTTSSSPACATTRAQAFYARRTQEGKTRREIIRCLKRYAAHEVFNLVRPVSLAPAL